MSFLCSKRMVLPKSDGKKISGLLFGSPAPCAAAIISHRARVEHSGRCIWWNQSSMVLLYRLIMIT